MQDRIVEIIHVIFQQTLDVADIFAEQRRITTQLLSAGYDKSEVRSVFSWLQRMNLSDRVISADKVKTGSFKPARVTDGDNRLYISPEAYETLHRLGNNGVVDHRLHNDILDLAMGLPIEEISVKTVESLATMILLMRYHNDDERHFLAGPDEENEGLLN